MKKNITFRIEESTIEKLNELRGNTSQNAFLEQLIASFGGTNASKSTSTGVTEKRVAEMIQEALSNLTIEQETPKPEPIQPKKSKPKYSKTYSFTIPETAKIGEPEKETKQYGVYPLTWLLSEGQRAHYDKDGALIPYRHTDEDGNIIEPDEYDMDQIQAEHDRIKEEKRRKEEEEDNSPW